MDYVIGIIDYKYYFIHIYFGLDPFRHKINK